MRERKLDGGFVEWDLPVVVRLSAETRRAIGRKLGKRGTATRKQMECVVTDLVADWISDAIAAPSRGPR